MIKILLNKCAELLCKSTHTFTFNIALNIFHGATPLGPQKLNRGKDIDCDVCVQPCFPLTTNLKSLTSLQHLDKDKNGKVTLAEVEEVGLSLGFSLEQAQRLFKR